MSNVLSIAREESRLWLRSRLALFALLIFAVLLAAVSITTSLRMSEEHRERSEQQALAEETFLIKNVASGTFVMGQDHVEARHVGTRQPA